MSILNFKEANCKNCYRCLRTCPVKAISFTDSKARVIDDKCILCGHCVRECPQNAKHVRDDLPLAKQILKSGRRVVASVAPSYAASFSAVSKEKLFSAIALLGFDMVEDTAIGAEFVSKKYAELIAGGKFKNFITSACPAVVRMIEHNYHNALEYLAPVDSPMVAHAKIIKEKYGADTSVIFIGPCIAKKHEARKSGQVDVALTFEELVNWFESENINPEKVEINNEKITDFKGKAYFYPINRGIIKSFYEYDKGYDYVYVDGVEGIGEVLANIEDLSGMVIEISACANSCVNGPCSLEKKGGFLKANEQVRSFAKNNSEPPSGVESSVNIAKVMDRVVEKKLIPTEREIRALLQKLGKDTPSDELNCGACGYDTCRDKAIAVYNGVATLDMCLPFMWDRAESLSSEMFRNSPNGVVAIDDDMVIHNMNNVALDIFGIKDKNVVGKNLCDYINPTEFLLAMNGEKIINKKICIDNTDRWVKMSIYKVEKHNLMLCTLNDITRDVSYEESRKKVKLEMAETTQKVIEKQMEIVQEIASLLGETTADTKVALTKLKKVVMEEYEEEKDN